MIAQHSLEHWQSGKNLRTIKLKDIEVKLTKKVFEGAENPEFSKWNFKVVSFWIVRKNYHLDNLNINKCEVSTDNLMTNT